MKLNEKALKKIQDEMEHGEYQIPCGYENVEGMSIYHLEEHEFEPDDFKEMVCLTVEEAKDVLECVDACTFPSPFEGFVSKNILLRDKLKKRIEKAEIKHIKREIAQLKKEQARDNLEIERLEESYKNSTYSVLEQVGTEKQQ